MNKTFNEQLFIADKKSSVPSRLAVGDYYYADISFKPGPGQDFFTVRAVIDCGAPYAVMISPKILERLNPSKEDFLGTTETVTFNGTREPPLLTISSCFRFGDRIIVSEPIVVIPNLFVDAVIGAALLRQFTVTLQPDGKVLLAPHAKTIGILDAQRVPIDLKPALKAALKPTG